jgi:hypothetical protein
VGLRTGLNTGEKRFLPPAGFFEAFVTKKKKKGRVVGALVSSFVAYY